MALPPPEAFAAPPADRSYLRPEFLALVFLGGTAGTASRLGLSLVLPASGGIPVGILLANLCGAFLLGLLLEALARGGKDVGRRRRLRLLAGTGFLGGFTTYSTLATDGVLLLASGATRSGVGYLVGTLVFGALATWCGIALGAVLARRRKAEKP